MRLTSAAACCMRPASPSTTGLPLAADSAALVVLPAAEHGAMGQHTTPSDRLSRTATWRQPTRHPRWSQQHVHKASNAQFQQNPPWPCGPFATGLRFLHCFLSDAGAAAGSVSCTTAGSCTHSPMSKGGECSHLPYQAAIMSSGTARLEAGVSTSACAMHSAISLSSVTCRKCTRCKAEPCCDRLAEDVPLQYAEPCV